MLLDGSPVKDTPGIFVGSYCLIFNVVFGIFVGRCLFVVFFKLKSNVLIVCYF